MACSITAMMNWNALHDLARERSRDMINDASHSRRRLASEQDLPASEVAYLYGRSARLIDARVRAQAHPRVTASALDRS
jgi:hypothetical protein